MKLSKTLFANLFDAETIIPARLRSFAKAVLANLAKNNKNGEYDALIDLITSRLAALSGDMNGIDVNVGTQKISTKQMMAFKRLFASFMSKKAPFIADALGGEDSDGYLSFYPSGITEYHKANYTTLEGLTARVQTVATTYQTDLGSKLAQPMMAFKGDYDKLYDSHLQGGGAVKTERADRTGALLQLQLGLTQAVFTVASLYTGNEEMCEAVFPFAMLYPQSRRVSTTLAGELAMDETKELMNYRFGSMMEITIDNKSDNADLALWLSFAPADARPAKVIVVKAGETKTMRLPRLGNLEKTCLLAANLSLLNAASYSIEITGLRKEKKPKPVSKKAAKEKMEVA